MDRLKPFGRSSAIPGLVAWVLVLVVVRTVVAIGADLPQVVAKPQRRTVAIDIPWLIASEDEPWTVALAAPVAAHLGKSGPSPLVMAITSPPTREAEWLLSLASGRRPIVLATSDSLKLGATLRKRSPEVLQIGSDPSEASASGGEAVLEAVVAKSSWRWPMIRRP